MKTATTVRHTVKIPGPWVPAHAKYLELGLSPIAAMLRGWVLPLWQYQHKDGAQPSRSALAKRCGCSVPTITRAVKELRRRGYLTTEQTRTRQRRNVNAYTLCDPFSADHSGDLCGSHRFAENPEQVTGQGGGERCIACAVAAVACGPNGCTSWTGRPIYLRPHLSIRHHERCVAWRRPWRGAETVT